MRILRVICLILVFSIVAVGASQVTTVYADDDPLGWLDKSGGDNPLQGLEDTSISLGKGSYSLARTIGSIIAALVVTILGISWSMAKSGSDLKDKKSWAVNIFVGLLIFFGANFIISLIFEIAGKID